MTEEESMKELIRLMIENQEVLMRLKGQEEKEER